MSEVFFIRESLFSGERLRVIRDRVGRSQRAQARFLNESRWEYQLREQARDDAQTIILTPQEWCKLMRWRSTASQGEIARAINKSRAWLNKMEQGLAPCDDLLSHWALDESKKTTEAPTTKGTENG